MSAHTSLGAHTSLEAQKSLGAHTSAHTGLGAHTNAHTSLGAHASRGEYERFMVFSETVRRRCLVVSEQLRGEVGTMAAEFLNIAVLGPGLQKMGPVGPVKTYLVGQKERDTRFSSLFVQKWCFSYLYKYL